MCNTFPLSVVDYGLDLRRGSGVLISKESFYNEVVHPLSSNDRSVYIHLITDLRYRKIRSHMNRHQSNWS